MGIWVGACCFADRPRLGVAQLNELLDGARQAVRQQRTVWDGDASDDHSPDPSGRSALGDFQLALNSFPGTTLLGVTILDLALDSRWKGGGGLFADPTDPSRDELDPTLAEVLSLDGGVSWLYFYTELWDPHERFEHEFPEHVPYEGPSVWGYRNGRELWSLDDDGLERLARALGVEEAALYFCWLRPTVAISLDQQATDEHLGALLAARDGPPSGVPDRNVLFGSEPPVLPPDEPAPVEPPAARAPADEDGGDGDGLLVVGVLVLLMIAVLGALVVLN